MPNTPRHWRLGSRRVGAAIEEFDPLREREFTEWFLPFFEQFVALARTARSEDLDLFVVSRD